MEKSGVEVKRHLDAISHNKAGELALGASSLNTKHWTGCLSFFENPEDAPATPKASAQLDAGITDLYWIPNCDRLAVCGDNGAVYLWKLSSEKNSLTCLSQRTEHDDIVSRLSGNCDGSKMISTSYDRSIKVWDTEEFVPAASYTAHHGIVWDAVFHPTHPDVFISCSQDGRLLLWDQRKLKPASVIDCKGLPSLPTCVAWQPNQEYGFAVGTEVGQVVLQDTRATEVTSPLTLSVHSRLVYRIAFSPQRANWLASVSQDCTVVVTEFDSTSGDMFYRDWSHKDFVHGVSWNPVNNALTTCSWDSKVISREIQPKEPETNCRQAVEANHVEAMDTEQTMPVECN